MRKVGWAYHSKYLEHDNGDGHIERISRLKSIIRQLKRDEVDTQLIPIDVKPSLVDWIKEVHDSEYIYRFKNAGLKNIRILDSPDTPLCPKTYEVALWSTGGILSAIDKVMDGTVDRAFCAVRPPGHHAIRNQSMGFCFFNNIAIGAKYLQKQYNINKIFILDWDVHHGNGTQQAFERDSSVLFTSIHQDPLYCYPGSGFADEIGLEEGKGYTLNCPMPVGDGDDDYYKVLVETVFPYVDKFKPEMILISAGFDAHVDDPLGDMNITEKGFAKMTEMVSALSDQFCNGKIISVLEGGYNLTALGKCVSDHIQALIHS